MATKTLISWNVNGIRAVAKKGFLDWLKINSYDLVALQEIKMAEPEKLDPALYAPENYRTYWHPATRPGYSGVAVYAKDKPLSTKTDFGSALPNDEGRILELDFGSFVFLNIYFPNGKASPERLTYKLNFYKNFLAHITKLRQAGRKVIFCGDVNTAHQPLDLARPKENEKTSGFLPIERAWIDQLISAGFIDTYRYFHPTEVAYSWWDMKTHARERNVGWRIDYFFVSNDLEKNLVDSFILPQITGSDHCPVGLTLKI